VSIRVEGGNALGELAAALRSASQGSLVQELGKGLQQEAEPLPAAIRQAADNMLPKAGGLAADVANARTGVTVTSRSAHEVVVQVSSVSGMDLPRIDKGRVRHPVFGNREHWETQHVPPGYFTRTVLARAAGFRSAAERAVQKIADRIR